MTRHITGSTLIVVMLVFAIIFILMVTYNTIITIESRATVASNDANTALYLADAGLERTFGNLVQMQRSVFDETKNKGKIYDKTSFYTSGEDIGYYKAVIYGNNGPAEYLPITPDYMPLGGIGSDFGTVTLKGGGGKYNYRFTVEVEGWIERRGNEVAHRTVMAKILIRRGEDFTDYPGYWGCGKIEAWYEKNR